MFAVLSKRWCCSTVRAGMGGASDVCAIDCAFSRAGWAGLQLAATNSSASARLLSWLDLAGAGSPISLLKLERADKHSFVLSDR